MTLPKESDDRMIARLRLAIYGDYEVKKHVGEDVDHLIWRVGEMRRQIDNAHAALDVLEAPRTEGDSNLTISGRITKAL